MSSWDPSIATASTSTSTASSPVSSPAYAPSQVPSVPASEVQPDVAAFELQSDPGHTDFRNSSSVEECYRRCKSEAANPQDLNDYDFGFGLDTPQPESPPVQAGGSESGSLADTQSESGSYASTPTPSEDGSRGTVPGSGSDDEHQSEGSYDSSDDYTPIVLGHVLRTSSGPRKTITDVLADIHAVLLDISQKLK